MSKGALAEVEAVGLGVDHSLPSTAVVTNKQNYSLFTPHPLC